MKQKIRPDFSYKLPMGVASPVVTNFGQIVYVILPKMIDKNGEDYW